MPKKNIEPEKVIFPDSYIVCGADLSLRRPGWCILEIENKKIKSVRLFSIDNKAKKKSHGQILSEINHLFVHEMFPVPKNTFFVREQEVLHMKVPSERDVSKVVGLMDFALWRLAEKEWYSIYPVTVKKLVTGSGKAEKSEVAAALDKYLGKQDYKCDDESDAAAVAVAWLIQQGELL